MAGPEGGEEARAHGFTVTTTRVRAVVEGRDARQVAIEDAVAAWQRGDAASVEALARALPTIRSARSMNRRSAGSTSTCSTPCAATSHPAWTAGATCWGYRPYGRFTVVDADAVLQVWRKQLVRKADDYQRTQHPLLSLALGLLHLGHPQAATVAAAVDTLRPRW